MKLNILKINENINNWFLNGTMAHTRTNTHTHIRIKEID